MNATLMGLLLVVAAAVVAGGVALLQQRFSPPQNREGYNEVAGSVFEIISVLYAIVLAFVLIAVWEQRDEARDLSSVEAGALVDVYWSAQDMPDPQRAALEDLCQDYATTVIDVEWPAMNDQERIPSDGWEIVDAMNHHVEEGMPEEDETTLGLAQDAGESITALSDARTERINANVEGLTGVMWLVLIAGALLMFGILLLFGIPGKLAHIVVVVISAAMVVLLLYSIFELEFPFSRGIALPPDAFVEVLERLRRVSSG